MSRTLLLTSVVLGLVTLPVRGQDRPLIVVDPGHGGEQAGVTAAGHAEKDLVLRAAFATAEALVIRGFDVRLTRTGDYNPPNDGRVAEASAAGAALFISLHFNGDEDTTKFGIEIYADMESETSRTAAGAIADGLRTMGTPVVVEARPWGFLRSSKFPILMIEAGFLTHPVERRMILSQAYQAELGETLAEAVAEYLAHR